MVSQTSVHSSVAMSQIVLFLGAFLLWSPQSLEAQEQVTVGALVRITAPSISKDRLVGTVIATTADTFMLRPMRQAEPLAIPLASVTNLEVSKGKKRSIGKGALIGLLVGASTGAILGAALYEDCEICDISVNRSDWAFFAGGVFGLGGTVVGALRGARRTDQWQEIPLDRIRVSILPQPQGGLMLSASVAF